MKMKTNNFNKMNENNEVRSGSIFWFVIDVIKSFGKGAKAQAHKGKEKYNTTLNPFTPHYDWLQMAEEEQIDGYVYLRAERTKRSHVLHQVRERLDSIEYIMAASQAMNRDKDYVRTYINEIEQYLDALEGKAVDLPHTIQQG